LTSFKAHIIHVGNMNNKGTQALINSDVSVLREAIEDISISVSTTDITGVKKLDLPLSRVLPPMVDIPYDKADQISKKLGFDRSSSFYKILTLALLFLMPVQIFLSLISVILSKIGFKAAYRNEVIESIKKSNVVISHSDENFKETASLLPLNLYWIITWWSMLISRTLDIMVSRSLGKPVVMFPNSVGPFRTLIGRFLSRLSLNSCDYILIRDPVSYRIVDEVGINTAKILTYDTAILFNRPSNATFTTVDRPVIGVSPGIYGQSLSAAETRKYISAHARALDTAIEKHGFSIVFLPHYISGFKHDDLDVSNSIIEKMKNRSHTQIIKTDNVAEFCLLLNRMDMVISSKMHPAILAAIGFVPVLCISYDHKQTAFFQRLNMTECVLNIREISYKRLYSKIDETWDKRMSLEKSLRRQIPKWQKNVKATIEKTVSRYIERAPEMTKF
jgi:polysaccharide pyruvyl transferase WcaK-like protein